MKTAYALTSLTAIAPLLLACGIDDRAGDGNDAFDSLSAEVQTAYQAQFFVDKTNRDARVASGAVFTPFLNPNQTPKFKNGIRVRGTCGVTFITGQYAISAAHCFSAQHVPNPATMTFKVQGYDVGTMSNATLAAGRQIVGGVYPNWSSAHTFTAVEGYNVTTFNCRLIAKCDPMHGKFGVCDPNGVIINADIALLKCEDRPMNAPSLKVIDSDPQTGPVEMNWYHEVYRMPISNSNNPVLQDRFVHYTLLPADRGENFHYLGGIPGGPEKNQLLPLRSQPWPNNVPRTRGAIVGTTVRTDLFGCHGTSGSGVLQQNVAGGHVLLGPVATGGTSLQFRLCIDATTTQPGDFQLGYTKAIFTKALEVWAIAHP